MPTDVDRQIQRSQELIQRMSTRQVRIRARSAMRRVRRAIRYAAISISVILALTIGWAVVSPIGIEGLLLSFLAMGMALILSILFSAERAPPVRELGTIDFVALPSATERWLDAQRPALPAPAIPVLDRIGERLEALAPQLRGLNPDEPAAREVRALLSDHLPQLVSDYRAIPQDLRRVERNGRVPDRQLVESLSVIEQEIGEMTGELARGDLDRLAAHGRYLEIKYQETKGIAEG